MCRAPRCLAGGAFRRYGPMEFETDDRFHIFVTGPDGRLHGCYAPRPWLHDMAKGMDHFDLREGRPLHETADGLERYGVHQLEKVGSGLKYLAFVVNNTMMIYHYRMDLDDAMQ